MACTNESKDIDDVNNSHLSQPDLEHTEMSATLALMNDFDTYIQYLHNTKCLLLLT